MTFHTSIQTSSLLPYLESGENNFRLEISLVSKDSKFLEKAPFPFLLISDSGPFTRVIDAKILTDAESVIKPVFLMQQSDAYRLTSDDMWPLNNRDVDRLWQEAFVRYSAQTAEESPDRSHFVLLRQIDKKGTFSPFQSLFYCTFRNDYFQPPCARCGRSLHLCQDDNLLSESDLKPYSTSLKRYLYCPKCAQDSNPNDFYVFSLDAFDPPTLKDHLDLINEWGHLIVNPITLNHFPCIDCSEKTRCYGNDNLAVSRIFPFSFYPFYLMILEADTLNAHDFLALISGATLDEVKDSLSGKRALGRVKCLEAARQKLSGPSPFLFDQHNERNFLEVLYLKLSFLGELARMIFSDRGSVSLPDFSYSLERIWVKLADQASLLPLFWNFSLDVIDIGVDPVKPPHLSKYPPAHGLHFLGNAWFYALLVNHQQPVEQVQTELEKFTVELTSTEVGLSELIKKNELNPVFAAENIFWRPEARHVIEDWRGVWEKSLDLGGTLLVAGMNRETSWSENEFWQNYEALREEIKTELFGRGSLIPKKVSQSDNLAISALLNEILVRWRSKVEEQKDRKEAEQVEETLDLSTTTERAFESQKESAYEDGELRETVILRPHESGKKEVNSTKPSDPEETLILSPQGHPGSDKADNALQDAEVIQETVILGSDDFKNKRPPSEPVITGEAENDLPETVILAPDKKTPGNFDAGQQKDFTESFSKKKEVSTPAQDRGQAKKTTKEKKKHTLKEEDFLTETVILRTDKSEDNGSTNG
jgi:hypothetical protein